MTIKLDEFYTVESDASCWMLRYEKFGKPNADTGKTPVSRDVSYHANLKQTLTVYLDNHLKGSTDLQDVMRRITEVEQTIQNLKVS